jgi:TonB family protein
MRARGALLAALLMVTTSAAGQNAAKPDAFDPGLDVPLSDFPALTQPACPAEPCTPAIPITSHAVMPGDYPPDSVSRGEQGTVAVQYVISVTGDVADCSVTRSSGFPRLDAAACTMIRDRWKYRPATEGGKTIPQITTANIVFELGGYFYVPLPE